MKRFVFKAVDEHFHALKSRNFRIFWFGQLISLIGNWMQTIALPWLAYSITKSPFLLGVVGALQFTPTLLFSLFIGAVIDRFEKRKVILAAQSLMAVIALVLSALVLSGYISYWHILIIAVLQGCANAVEMPTRQTFMIEMVGKKDLMNAIGLNSATFNAARIIGPAAAGIVMTTIGIGYCFLINAASFVPIIIGLTLIRPLVCVLKTERTNVLTDIADGFRYIVKNGSLARIMLIVLIVGMFIMNFNVLVPVLAKTALKQGEAGFGFLMSCMGFGSLIGAISTATRSRQGPKTSMLFAMATAAGLCFVGISFSRNYALSAVLLAAAGFATVTFMTTANSSLQLSSDDAFRSRVISIYFFINVGSTPVGNLIVGALSGSVGIEWCFRMVGITVLLCLLLFAVLTRIRVHTQR